jgi:hypothetical protein
MTFGSKNTRAAKLDATKVHELRMKYHNGATQGSLAREYGISVNQVGRIVRGESWQQYHNPAMPEVQTMQPQREITDEEIQASLNKLQGMLGTNTTEVLETAENGIPLIIPKEDVKYSTLDQFITDVREEKENGIESKLEKFLGEER